MRNTAFMFDTFTFTIFCELVANLTDKALAGEIEYPVKLPTFNSGLDLLLDKPAFRALHRLLDGADTEMKAARMTSMFYY